MLQAEEDAVAVGHQDLPQAIQLLAEMGESADKVSKLVDSMLARVKRGEISTAKVSIISQKLISFHVVNTFSCISLLLQGLSFLEVKYHTLLSYLINLSYVVLRKSSGVTICNDPSIGKLL